MNTVRDWLLSQSDLARLDCELIACRRLRLNRAQIIAHPEHPISRTELAKLTTDAQRLRDGEPVAYLTGTRDFWNLTLEVTPDVLIPRSDTETLVEQALERAREGDRILDLGTGSGAIAIAIETTMRAGSADADVWGLDNSTAALEVARRNATACNADVQFLNSDWFSALTGQFNMILANPPYVAAEDPQLQSLAYEPRTALVSGEQGLADLRRIVCTAPHFLDQGGWLLVEHGCDQGGSVTQLFADSGFTRVKTVKDLANLDRITLGQLFQDEQASHG